MHPSAINRHGAFGIVLLLSLIAQAMLQVAALAVVLPLLTLAVILYMYAILECAADYPAVARTVCKNE